jgi:mannose-6-phosphate isomerase-like protein (cupin superfamily)
MPRVASRSGASRTVLVNQPSASAPLTERIGHNDESRHRTTEGNHGGAGALRYASLLEGTDFSANLFFLHRGVLMPGGGIGHHFHNTVEEMYVIFDNEAEFTVDGRTSLLSGPVAAPCRLGHSHAIYNRSDRPTEWMNICVSVKRGTYDTFDLGDDRVDAEVEAKPSFMSIALDPSVLDDESTVRVRRTLVSGVLRGPWHHVDYVNIGSGGRFTEDAHEDLEEFVYVISGSGRAQVEGEQATISAGDAVPVLHGQSHSFSNEGTSALELMTVGIVVT